MYRHQKYYKNKHERTAVVRRALRAAQLQREQMTSKREIPVAGLEAHPESTHQGRFDKMAAHWQAEHMDVIQSIVTAYSEPYQWRRLIHANLLPHLATVLTEDPTPRATVAFYILYGCVLGIQSFKQRNQVADAVLVAVMHRAHRTQCSYEFECCLEMIASLTPSGAVHDALDGGLIAILSHTEHKWDNSHAREMVVDILLSVSESTHHASFARIPELLPLLQLTNTAYSQLLYHLWDTNQRVLVAWPQQALQHIFEPTVIAENPHWSCTVIMGLMEHSKHTEQLNLKCVAESIANLCATESPALVSYCRVLECYIKLAQPLPDEEARAMQNLVVQLAHQHSTQPALELWLGLSAILCQLPATAADPACRHIVRTCVILDKGREYAAPRMQYLEPLTAEETILLVSDAMALD